MSRALPARAVPFLRWLARCPNATASSPFSRRTAPLVRALAARGFLYLHARDRWTYLVSLSPSGRTLAGEPGGGGAR